MGLRITRAVDSKLYGGFDLDPTDKEGTYDHCVWVRKVTNTATDKRVLVNIASDDGVIERIMDVGDVHDLLDNVSIRVTGIASHWMDTKPYCDACGRGDKIAKRQVPQAKFAVEAPRSYDILRHDAKRT